MAALNDYQKFCLEGTIALLRDNYENKTNRIFGHEEYNYLKDYMRNKRNGLNIPSQQDVRQHENVAYLYGLTSNQHVMFTQECELISNALKQFFEKNSPWSLQFPLNGCSSSYDPLLQQHTLLH